MVKLFFQTYPDVDAIPDRSEVAQSILSELNGETIDGKVRVKIVGGTRVQRPRQLKEYKQ